MLIRRTSFLFLIALGGLLLLPHRPARLLLEFPVTSRARISSRTQRLFPFAVRLSGDNPLGLSEASDHLFNAANDAQQLQAQSKTRLPNAIGGAWSAIGPNPIVQVSAPGHFVAVSGRIGALAIRSDGRRILGAAQGGIWVWNKVPPWEPRAISSAHFAIGALAVAPRMKICLRGQRRSRASGDSYRVTAC